MPKTDATSTEVVDVPQTDIPTDKSFTCVRCGYQYQKNFDSEPFLCNRCMRFISKKSWTIIHTIQPVNSAPPKPAEG